MPADAQKISVLRVVIREDFSRPRCELFVKALSEVVEILQDMDEGAVASERRDLSRSKGGTAAMVNKTRAIC